MNIGLFTDTYFPQVSGVATSIQTLRDELEAQGHNVYIFTTTDPKVDKDAHEPQIYRFSSVPYVGFKERRMAFRGLVQAVQLAKSLHLDIVHTHTEFSLGLLGKVVARQLHIPVVHTYHTMYQDYLHYIANGKLLRPGSVEVVMRYYLKGVQAVIAPSDKVEDVLTGYQVTTRMAVIPTGVKIPAGRPNGTSIRQALGLNQDQSVILSLGRLAFEKNIETTIAAFAEIRENNQTAKLVIVGDGPARSSLEEHAEALGVSEDVIFTGMVAHDEVAKYFAAADVFVSSSDSETQGITFIEATAANRPFVALPSPFLENYVTHRAIGTLAESFEDYVTAIEAYLTQKPGAADEHHLRQAALQAVDARTFGRKVEALYQDVLAHYERSSEDENNELNEDEISYAKRLFRNPFRRFR
jgi:1,2-diacylglycerol 3-alpha-glucosyltransferase